MFIALVKMLLSCLGKVDVVFDVCVCNILDVCVSGNLDGCVGGDISVCVDGGSCVCVDGDSCVCVDGDLDVRVEVENFCIFRVSEFNNGVRNGVA